MAQSVLLLRGRFAAELTRLLEASEVLCKEWILEASAGELDRIQKRIRGDSAIAGVGKGRTNEPSCT